MFQIENKYCVYSEHSYPLMYAEHAIMYVFHEVDFIIESVHSQFHVQSINCIKFINENMHAENIHAEETPTFQ